MRAAVSIGFVVAWDDDSTRRPSLPVRCLDDELVMPVVFPTTPPHKPRIDEVAKQRHAKYLRDVQGKCELRRRPGLTKATKHE